MDNNLFDLKKKTFLVTGASSGLGYEVCKTINQYNGNFIAVARREDQLQNLLAECANPANSYIVADLKNNEDIAKVIDGIGNIDGVVHSAGIVNLTPLKFYTQKIMDDIRLINYDSILKLMAGILKKKKLNKRSSIVLITSIAALNGTQGNGIYAGLKAALVGISKVWAHELAPSLSRVNCVSPGMVNTDVVKTSIEELSAEVIDIDRKKYLLYGYGEPYQVAHPVLFFLSEASNWITGQTLIVDGGRTL